MAGEELFRDYDIPIGGAGIGLTMRKENIGARDEKDKVVDGCALAGDGALEECGQEGV